MDSASRGCAKGCGFYGSDATLGFCSKCYLDHLFTAQMVNALETDTPSSAPAEGGGGHEVTACLAEAKTTAPQRCERCNKKVSAAMAAIGCRCGGIFCPVHRHAEEHACTFNYQAAGRLLLARSNPQLRADKMDKL